MNFDDILLTDGDRWRSPDRNSVKGIDIVRIESDDRVEFSIPGVFSIIPMFTAKLELVKRIIQHCLRRENI